MPSRSRVAVPGLLAAVGCLAGSAGADDQPAEVANRVQLQLRITGLTKPGTTIKIAPAHPGCQFKPVVRTLPNVASGGMVMLKPPIDVVVTSTGADRDCSFAITLQEPGRPPQTFRRGLRLKAAEAGEPMPVQSLPVYLSAPSLAAGAEKGKVRR